MEPDQLANVVAALYLDENLSVFIEGELRRRGHFATTTTRERRRGAPDSHQLLFAAEQGWTIITHNRDDFRLLHDAWLLWSHRWGTRQTHAGILVLQDYKGQTASDVADAISILLSEPATALENNLFEWKRSTGWVRFPD